MKKTSGDRAVKAGQNQESIIINFLTNMQRSGVKFEWRKLKSQKPTDSFCNSIYGVPIWTDFVVHGLPNYKEGFFIESKFQSVAGSGDEKFPYLYENIVKQFPLPTIVVLTLESRTGSPALKRRFDKIYNWWAEKVKEHHISGGNKLIGVVTVHQFQHWFEEQVGYFEEEN